MGAGVTRARTAAAGPAVPVGDGDRERLLEHARSARRRAGSRYRGGPRAAAITVDAPVDLDPSAVVAGGRAPGEPWTVYEQVDRERRVVATLGVVRSLEAAGPGRFATVARRWSRIAAEAVVDPGEGVTGEGLLAVGGFAFAGDGGRSPSWRGFEPASLHVPLLALARHGDRVRATIAVWVHPAGAPDEVEARVDAALARVAALAPARPPLLDPDPVRRGRIVSALPPAHYEQAVVQGTERIARGEMEKIVLAREVQVHDREPPDPAAVLGVMREAYEGCCVLAVGRGDRTFLAATPELLARREGSRLATLALAGTTRRSADPAVEDHLAEHLLRSEKDREEHAIVVRRILSRLDDLALWTTAPDEPRIARAASVQHLATPIRAQLRRPCSIVEIVERLHPTPAVGGFPEAVALPLIAAIEGMDRGWYAGPVGWTDAAGDGEFSVALRSALLEPGVSRCFAGVGVVAGSEPAAELAETEAKLQALLPLLAA